MLSLHRSKTDQNGSGRAVGMHYGKRGTCPVVALQAWLKERGSWPGPLFCGFDSQGRMKREAMPAEEVLNAVKAAAERAGLDPSRFGAHSLGAGLVTTAGENGVGVLAIAARRGHVDLETLQRYMGPSQALLVNPLAGVL